MGWVIGHGNSFIFRQGSGKQGQSYWATLISATVEDAAPNDFVLTFPVGKPTLDENDFTIAGFPLTGAVWAGAVLTLTSSVAVVYGDAPIITFVPTAGTASVTNNVIAETEYSTLLAALTGTTPSLAIRRGQNEFIKYLKGGNSDSRNTWAKLACIIPTMAGMPTDTDSLFWWNDPTRKATLSGTPPTYLLGQGWYGNGSSSYIDTTFNPSSDGGELYTQDNNSSGFLFTNHREAHNDTKSGLIDSSNNGTTCEPHYGAVGNLKIRVQGAEINTSVTLRSDQLFTLSRHSATHIYYYSNKIASAETANDSTALINGSVALLAVNKVGTGYQNYMIDTIGLYYAGASLDQTDVNVINDGLRLLVDVLCEEVNNGATITVGVGKDYTTLWAGIQAALSGDIVVVDAGTYNEAINLQWKKIKIIGSGARQTNIVFPDGINTKKPPVIHCTTGSELENLTIDNLNSWGGNMFEIEYGNPTFTDITFTRAATQRPGATITNNANVTMTGISFEIALGAFFYLKDTSRLNLEGTEFKVKLILSETAYANVDVDNFYADSTGTFFGITTLNSSELILKVNIGASAISGAGLVKIDGASKFTLSGNEIYINPTIYGNGCIVLYKDIINTGGFFWHNAVAGSKNCITTFDNCQIYLDLNNDSSGVHIIEDVPSDSSNEVRIINGSVLEFSGHNGDFFTMGNPIVCAGKIYIRNSTIIDNVNDNIPFGTNYTATLTCTQLDAEDAIITNQNWDGVGANVNVALGKKVGVPLTIRMKNVILNNAEINSTSLFINNINALDVTDYLCEENVIYNTTGGVLEVISGVAATILAELRAACPI